MFQNHQGIEERYKHGCRRGINSSLLWYKDCHSTNNSKQLFQRLSAPGQAPLSGTVFSPLPSTSGFSRCDWLRGGRGERSYGWSTVIAVEIMGVISRALGQLADQRAACSSSTWQLKTRPSALNLLNILCLSTLDNKMTIWSLLSAFHVQLQLFYCNLII